NRMRTKKSAFNLTEISRRDPKRAFRFLAKAGFFLCSSGAVTRQNLAKKDQRSPSSGKPCGHQRTSLCVGATMNRNRKRIICGTDFSVHAAEAADVAAVIAKRLDEAVILVHVEESGKLGGSHPETFAESHNRTRERLHAEAERLRSIGVTVK